MKKALLIIRIPVEAAFGVLYMTSLFLLPNICRGRFPQLLFFGFFGMPRQPFGHTAWFYFNAVAASAGLLLVAFLVSNGLLWFKNVRDIVRKLRTKQQA